VGGQEDGIRRYVLEARAGGAVGGDRVNKFIADQQGPIPAVNGLRNKPARSCG
jgi:hypothetical protein